MPAMPARAARDAGNSVGESLSTLRQRQCIVVFAALLALALIVAVIHAWQFSRDPAIPLLVPAGGAAWIVVDQPVNMYAQHPGENIAAFRRQFTLANPPARAILSTQGFRALAAYLDDRQILDEGADQNAWKQNRSVDLGPMLTPGQHVLTIVVMNETGPPALLVLCPELG